MTELDKLNKQYENAKKKYYAIINGPADGEFKEKFKQKEIYQKQFLKIWKKYNKNKTKYEKEFLEISYTFGNTAETFEKFRDELMKRVEPYDKEMKRLYKKIWRLEKKNE